jgi:hypothetical protein
MRSRESDLIREESRLEEVTDVSGRLPCNLRAAREDYPWAPHARPSETAASIGWHDAASGLGS